MKNLQNSGSKESLITSQAHSPMIPNVQGLGGQSQNKPSVTHYDQFLISCSDDGSINIYDCSSFRYSCNDEYYTKGVSDTNHVYVAHSKAITAKLQEESFFGTGPKTLSSDANFTKIDEIQQENINENI